MENRALDGRSSGKGLDCVLPYICPRGGTTNVSEPRRAFKNEPSIPIGFVFDFGRQRSTDLDRVTAIAGRRSERLLPLSRLLPNIDCSDLLVLLLGAELTP